MSSPQIKLFSFIFVSAVFFSILSARNINIKRTSLNRWSSGISIPKVVGLLCSLTFSLPSVSLADLAPAPWSPGVQYEVIKQAPADALEPKVGDLVAIRFRGSYKGNDFDDTFKTEQPYFYRAGVGLILKGLDDAVVNMHVGDRYHVTFGGELAFGAKGRPSAPGKPRIPPNAEVDYEVELVELPGTGDDFIADVEDSE